MLDFNFIVVIFVFEVGVWNIIVVWFVIYIISCLFFFGLICKGVRGEFYGDLGEMLSIIVDCKIWVVGIFYIGINWVIVVVFVFVFWVEEVYLKVEFIKCWGV